MGAKRLSLKFRLLQNGPWWSEAVLRARRGLRGPFQHHLLVGEHHFSIFEKNGEKAIRIRGYFHEMPNSDSSCMDPAKPCRSVEYYGFEYGLNEFLAKDLNDPNKMSAEACQYQTCVKDLSEEDAIYTMNSFYDGKPPVMYPMYFLTMDTSCGNYVDVSKYMDADLYSIRVENGVKYICVDGYFYAGEDLEENPVKTVEICGMDYELQEFIQEGLTDNKKRYEKEAECKQYIDDIMPEDIAEWIGYEEKILPYSLSRVSMDTPCGDYIDA